MNLVIPGHANSIKGVNRRYQSGIDILWGQRKMHVVGSHQRGQEKPKEEQRHQDRFKVQKKFDPEEDVTQDRPQNEVLNGMGTSATTTESKSSGQLPLFYNSCCDKKKKKKKRVFRDKRCRTVAGGKY
jgi:hypothetical protein